MKKTYAFSLDWFGENLETEKIRGFISAESYADAVKEISARFPDMMNNLYIDEMFETGGFVFVNDEETFNKLIEENNYGD